MDTEKVRVLLTAIETGSLTAAAQALGYTPSGISRSVAALEDEMGFPLLFRSRNGVSATKAGLQMLPLFEELLRQEKRCRQFANEIKGLEIGEISVGTAYFKYYPQLCQWISAFTECYPGITVKIVEGLSSELSEMLEKGKLDFCIISKREGLCRWFPLLQDELVVRVPKNHPAAKKGSASKSIFETEPYIEIFPGKDTDNARLLHQRGIHPKTRYATENDEAAFAMVEAGLGFTMGNTIQLADENKRLATLSLEPRHWVEIGIALPVAEMLSPAARRFAAFVMDDLNISVGR